MHFRKINLIKRASSRGYFALSLQMRKGQGHSWTDKIRLSKAQRHEKIKTRLTERNIQ